MKPRNQSMGGRRGTDPLASRVRTWPSWPLALLAAGTLFALPPMTAATRADAYEEGLSAYREARYRQAFPLLRAAAEAGDPRAQLLLSTFYRRGLGIDADEYLGFAWCQRAALQGLAEARFQLGLMYLDGEGVTEDEEEALRWLDLATAQGHRQAAEVLRYQLSDEYAAEYGC